MAYQALYRKYRPACFDDVKGQDHIVKTLKNQLKYNRLGHAYLFCGTRGTGKTSVAKLFAKAVNCENPTDGDPCGECEVCKAIASGASLNVIEIDAASNNGVENVREIIEEVRYSPVSGKYKVYIIDEVHMLSPSAFNALLKTLEEPPAYVIFILATTEVHKIPVTILSRCQRYDFHRISAEDIGDRIRELVVSEDIKIDDAAIRHIARAADGAMRDALSILDRCVSFYLGEELTYDRVLSVLGTADYETFAIMLRKIKAGAVEDCLKLLDGIILSGRDITQFTSDFTWYLRDLLLAKTADCPEEILEASSEMIEAMKHEAQVFDTQVILRYIRILSELSNQLRFAVQKRILIEVALIKLCRPQTERDNDSLTDRIEKLEDALESGEFVKTARQGENTEGSADNGSDTDKEVTRIMYERAVPEDIKEAARHYREMIAKLPTPDRIILTNATPTPGNDKLVFVLLDETDYSMINRPEKVEQIERAFAEACGKEIKVEFSIHKGTAAQFRKIPNLLKMFENKNIPVDITD